MLAHNINRHKPRTSTDDYSEVGTRRDVKRSYYVSWGWQYIPLKFGEFIIYFYHTEQNENCIQNIVFNIIH